MGGKIEDAKGKLRDSIVTPHRQPWQLLPLTQGNSCSRIKKKQGSGRRWEPGELQL